MASLFGCWAYIYERRMNKEKILFIVTNSLVTMGWLLVEGKFETEARILGMRLARVSLLPSFVTRSKVFSLYLPYSLTVKYHFPYSKITNKDTKEKL